MLSVIVAMANKNVIGKDNKLIWHIPDDLKRFKKLTLNHVIIMGHKTFESLGRVLPNRKHIVLSKKRDYKVENENVEVINNINQLMKYIEDDNENFVIGGAMIYKLLMPYTNKLYITKINEDFEGDVFFPKINFNDWRIISRQKGIKNEANPYNYEYIEYIRK